MTNTYCDSCARWTDPATLIDGDCPGCVAARGAPDKHIHQSHDTERLGNSLIVCRVCGMADMVNEAGVAGWGNLEHRCPTDQPITPEYLRERGFVEPTG